MTHEKDKGICECGGVLVPDGGCRYCIWCGLNTCESMSPITDSELNININMAKKQPNNKNETRKEKADAERD